MTRRNSANSDYFFISLTFILAIFGLVMLTSASSDIAKLRFGDSYYYLKHQLVYGFALGLFGFTLGYVAYYRFWEKLSLTLLIVNIILLGLVFTPLGVNIKGAERWLNFGGISFQPSEIIKLTFLIYLSAWVSKNQIRHLSFFKGLLPFLILLGAVSFLLVLEPATTTAVLIFTASMIVYFMGGAKFRFIAGSIILAIIGLATIIYVTPYRLQRVMSYINPQQDSLGSGYHINQALIAIGSGGITGIGYGNSTTKLKYLPEPIGDSIFAIVSEELGFVGSIALIATFLMFVWRGLMIAKNAKDHFGQLLVTGFIALMGLQVFVNIGAISGLIPLTGVPLPFISYGGTSLAVFLTMCGIIVNVSKYR